MDDDDRTTREGFFNTAEAYRLSAVALQQHPVEIGHADKPVQFLYSHAIELYLKALLRQKHSVKTIRDQFRHNIQKLVEEAETLGLVVACEDRDVFAVMEDTDVLLEMRYIRTGSKTSLETAEPGSCAVRPWACATAWPTLSCSKETCCCGAKAKRFNWG